MGPLVAHSGQLGRKVLLGTRERVIEEVPQISESAGQHLQLRLRIGAGILEPVLACHLVSQAQQERPVLISRNVRRHDTLDERVQRLRDEGQRVVDPIAVRWSGHD